MRTIILFMVALAASTVAVALVVSRIQPPPAPIAIQSQGPTIQRLERLCHLVPAPWSPTYWLARARAAAVPG